MSVKRVAVATLTCALLYAPPAFGQEFKTIYNEVVGERRVVAVAVQGAYYIGDLIDDLRPYAGPDTTLLAYINHEALSDTEPLVVYVDGDNVYFAERAQSSAASPTFAESMAHAMIVTRGARSGAICRDGTRTERTNNGACTINGGLDRWLYTAVTTSDPAQVIAAICNDYRLVSGPGGRCGESGVMAQVKARPYPPHQQAEPVVEEPEEVAVVPGETKAAPLPDPVLAPPILRGNEVEWTERHNGRVGFAWGVSLVNPNADPVRAVVSVQLRDSDGEVIHSGERVVALSAHQEQSFYDEGEVDEAVAAQADRWTFDVALSFEAEPLDDTAATVVMLVVDPLLEEARVTNTGDVELDLSGWTLSSSVGGENFTFRFFKLGPGKSVTLSSGDGARSMLPEVYLWTSSKIWADDGDVGELRDGEGRLRAKTNPDGTAAFPSGGGSRRGGLR